MLLEFPLTASVQVRRTSSGESLWVEEGELSKAVDALEAMVVKMRDVRDRLQVGTVVIKKGAQEAT